MQGSLSQVLTAFHLLSHHVVFYNFTAPEQIQSLFPATFHSNLKNLITKILLEQRWQSCCLLISNKVSFKTDSLYIVTSAMFNVFLFCFLKCDMEKWGFVQSKWVSSELLYNICLICMEYMRPCGYKKAIHTREMWCGTTWSASDITILKWIIFIWPCGLSSVILLTRQHIGSDLQCLLLTH